MKKFTIIISAICAVTLFFGIMNNMRSDNKIPVEVVQAFNEFIAKHSRHYETPAEWFRRLNIFHKNYIKISMHNRENTSTYTMGINKFSDLSEEEFRAKYTGFLSIKNAMKNQKFDSVHKSIKAAPASIDWSTKGAVTSIKNQGQCGSCWAFSTTGSVEGAWQIAGNGLVSFSEQQLVDCSGSYGNHGCNGGLMDYAFKYIERNGITTESDYPYKARDGYCKYKRGSGVGKISSYRDVSRDEGSLKDAVAINPVSIAIYAIPIQSYTGGIFSNYAVCPPGQLDHGVLAVGYGTDGGNMFWKVKNSWGASWGESGYIRFARKNSGPGICGLATSASYPII